VGTEESRSLRRAGLISPSCFILQSESAGVIKEVINMAMIVVSTLALVRFFQNERAIENARAKEAG